MTEVPCPDSSEGYKKLYTTLLEAIPASVLVIDRNMRIVWANQNFLERSRRSTSETMGRRLEDVFPAIILNRTDIIHQIEQAFAGKQPSRQRRMTYRAPGIPMRIYYYRIFPFRWNGDVENIVVLMNDVTEQVRLNKKVHRVERHLASVVESASDIVLSTDMKGRILSWNTAAEKLSGYTFHEVRKRYFLEYCDPSCDEEVEKVLNNLKDEQDAQRVEWDLITKQGPSVEVGWVLSTMKDDAGRTTGIVAVGRDLSERRKFQLELLQSQKLAALGVMAGGIAHEIRNPLAICSSAAQFLMDDDISPEFRKECSEKVYAGVHRAASIIENVLGFARPSSSAIHDQIDLVFLLQDTMNLVANHARIEKIEVTCSFPDESVMISGMAGPLQQLFMNLFLNAIKAMPDGGTLSISIDESDGEVRVRVSDTGCGIPKADMDKVFDPFYTTFPVGKGTGLGLSICYNVAKQHFGSIEVDSVEGKGSTFTVILPTV